MAGLQVRILRDEVSPALTRLEAGLNELTSVLESVGTEIVSITQKAFFDESLRVSAWPPKRDGSPATLVQSGALKQSIRITGIGSTSVTVGSDRVYAAIHQLGGVIKPESKRVLVFNAGGKKIFAKKVTMPARPFFPIDSSWELAEFAQERVVKVLTDALRIFVQPKV